MNARAKSKPEEEVKPPHRPPKYQDTAMGSLSLRTPQLYKELLQEYCEAQNLSMGDWLDKRIEEFFALPSLRDDAAAATKAITKAQDKWRKINDKARVAA